MQNSLQMLLKYILDCNKNSIMLLGRLTFPLEVKKKISDTMDKAET